MNGKWVFNKEFGQVVERAEQFECNEVVLDMKPILIESDRVIFGCYIPTQPRPTSILLGRIILRKLDDQRTELRAVNLPDWAGPFLQALVTRIGEFENRLV